MKIADLFVNIGVAGASTVGKGLEHVKKGMNDIVSSSLQAKAAMLAVITGLERLTGMASQTGMDLYKFGATTGLSTQELQKWQYAAMKFDVSGKEMEGTITGVQSAMSDMMLGKGAPEAMMALQNAVGFDPEKSRDTFYVMGKIQEFIKSMPVDAARSMSKSFGISDNVFQMLRMSTKQDRNALGRRVINPKEIETLKNINIQWKEFWFNLENIGTKFIASETFGKFFKVLADGGAAIVEFGSWISSLIERSPAAQAAFLLIGLGIASMMGPLVAASVAITALIALFGELKKYANGEALFGGMISAESVNKFKSMMGSPAAAVYDWLHPEEAAATAGGPSAMAPRPVAAASAGSVVNNVTVKQENYGVPDTGAANDKLTRTINATARQLGSNAEGK